LQIGFNRQVLLQKFHRATQFIISTSCALCISTVKIYLLWNGPQ
jgi:hypothetical protein